MKRLLTLISALALASASACSSDDGGSAADVSELVVSGGEMSESYSRADLEALGAVESEFNGQELLEVSHVTIPSNPDALQRMKGPKLAPALAEVVDEILSEAGDVSDVQLVADPVPAIEVRVDRL